MCGVINIFMVGDVMLARGIDMVQAYCCDPKLYEGYGMTANDYVTLTVRKNGPLPDKSERGPGYVWGDALQILSDFNPDLRIINLETSITTSGNPWPLKGIHYKMHPKNVDIIKSAQIDCCVLSNNHVADWGYEGLRETLASLKNANISYAGAGLDSQEAETPAIFEIPGKGRVLIFALGHHSSGVPMKWKAQSKHEGLHMLPIETPAKSVPHLKKLIMKYKREGDIVVLSIHWGGNWGYEIEDYFRTFAQSVIDGAGVDLIHGHSSHHSMGVEVYKGKLIIYGCGDFINDYEGISGHDEYRGELALMYFAQVDASNGHLRRLQMVPTEMKKFRVNRAEEDDFQWMHATMSRECKKNGLNVRREGGALHLVFEESAQGTCTHL